MTKFKKPTKAMMLQSAWGLAYQEWNQSGEAAARALLADPMRSEISLDRPETPEDIQTWICRTPADPPIDFKNMVWVEHTCRRNPEGGWAVITQLIRMDVFDTKILTTVSYKPDQTDDDVLALMKEAGLIALAQDSFGQLSRNNKILNVAAARQQAKRPNEALELTL